MSGFVVLCPLAQLEALEQENARHAQRELSWHLDDDGYWVVRGRFTLEQGSLIQKELEEVMEDTFRLHGTFPREFPESVHGT